MVLHQGSGAIALEAELIDEYACRNGLAAAPAILDGDVRVELLLHGHLVATAQLV